MNNILNTILLVSLFFWNIGQANAQVNTTDSIPAFPGAEGFGAHATGGRGGTVIEVTNLDDSGVGSLRDAIGKSGARTIVFRVSGTIMLNSTLSIKNNDITIAGQSAPGEGITLARYTFKVDADNVIIRYIRSRLGDTRGVQDDAMNGREQKNIIIDHCTMSWSVDEVASFYDNANFTLQYCIISEAMYNSIHDKGPHGYGGIWGGKGVSFHHNLFAHNVSRNPRFCGARYSNQPDLEKIDFRNNVLFNWGGNSIYGAEGGSYNLINNYYKPGPATKSGVRDRIIAPNADDGTNQQPAGVWGKFYVEGNYLEGSENTTLNNWNGVDANIGDINSIKSDTVFTVDSVSTQSAELAMEHVLAHAGASLPKRDIVDNRIVQEFISGIPTFGATYGSGKGIIDSQSDVGGWPELKSATATLDTDHDGMPDDWELAQGLDINNPEDRNGDSSGNGYTNLEDYLNGLVQNQTYIIRPSNFRVDSFNTHQINLHWDDVIDNETAYLLERKKGDAEFVQIAEIEANDSLFTDELTESGLYGYRLRAINTTDTSLFTQIVELELLTSISDINRDRSEYSIYPNPFNHHICVSSTGIETTSIKIKIFDMHGKHILSRDNITEQQTILNLDSLPKGVYFIQVSSAFKSYTQKIIKN